MDFSKLQQLKTDWARGMCESVLLIEESEWMRDIKACVWETTKCSIFIVDGDFHQGGKHNLNASDWFNIFLE